MLLLLPLRYVKHTQPVVSLDALLRFPVTNKILEQRVDYGFFNSLRQFV